MRCNVQVMHYASACRRELHNDDIHVAFDAGVVVVIDMRGDEPRRWYYHVDDVANPEVVKEWDSEIQAVIDGLLR